MQPASVQSFWCTCPSRQPYRQAATEARLGLERFQGSLRVLLCRRLLAERVLEALEQAADVVRAELARHGHGFVMSSSTGRAGAGLLPGAVAPCCDITTGARAADGPPRRAPAPPCPAGRPVAAGASAGVMERSPAPQRPRLGTGWRRRRALRGEARGWRGGGRAAGGGAGSGGRRAGPGAGGHGQRGGGGTAAVLPGLKLGIPFFLHFSGH